MTTAKDEAWHDVRALLGREPESLEEALDACALLLTNKLEQIRDEIIAENKDPKQRATMLAYLDKRSAPVVERFKQNCEFLASDDGPKGVH